MRYVILGGALTCCCLLSSNIVAQTPTPAVAKTLAERLKELEERVDLQQEWLTSLNALTGDRSVVLDCSGGTSLPIMPKTQTFEFLAICAAVDPYLEGYRIKVRIGNLQSMEFYGLEGDLGYGETLGKTYPQHVHFSTTDDLLPGVWTVIQVTINPAAAKDVRVIRLYGLTTKGTKAQPK